jgi:hypothetical protein
MNIQIILIPLAIGTGIAALSAWINITIRFANSAEDARRDIKRIFFIIVSFLSQCAVAYFLFTQLLSDEPLNRISVFSIVMCSLSIVVSTFAYLTFKLLFLIENSWKASWRMFQVLPCIKESLLKNSNNAKLDV